MTSKHIGSSLQEAIDQQKQDPAFTIAAQREQAISDIAQAAYELRLQAGLTQQTALAEKSHTTQQVIARLKGGKDQRLPSIDLLNRIAHAVGKKMIVQFC